MVKEHAKCSYIEVMESKMNDVDKKLDSINIKLEKISEKLSENYTSQALLKQDVNNLGIKTRGNEERINKLEATQNWLLAKISTAVSIISFILYFVYDYFLK